MRDLRNVQQPEANGQPDADGRIKAAEQDAENHGVAQQFDRKQLRPSSRRKAVRLLLAGSLKGRDQIASLQIVREQNNLLTRLAELIDVLVLDAAELRFDSLAFLPLAIFGKGDRADDGLHGCSHADISRCPSGRATSSH